MASVILGAGLSGLIAATQLPLSPVFERSSREHMAHRAVLRFRSDAVSRLTGIPFRKVTVRKSIWSDGEHVLPDIRLSNLYSFKTNGGYLDRSIWNLDAVERYIAPESLQDQLIEMIGENRVHFEYEARRSDIIHWGDSEGGTISTIPMPLMLDMLDLAHNQEFKHQGIVVDRYRVKNADVFQTIYFPDAQFPVYRASITGDLLIVERNDPICQRDLIEVLEAFGMGNMDVEPIDSNHHQRFGKIAPVDDAFRRNAIYEMTQEYKVYSLGRFAIWKNILLDDVVNDIAVIKRLMLGGKYSASLHHTKQKG